MAMDIVVEYLSNLGLDIIKRQYHQRVDEKKLRQPGYRFKN